MPASRADFWRDRESYLRNVEAGSIWYGHRQARVATAGTFTPFAIDNAQLLPCTNPLGRGEDALFAQCRALLPSGFARRSSCRSRSAMRRKARAAVPTRRSAAPPPRFNYFVSDFVQRQLSEFLAEDPAQRLGLLAANLRDIAGASEARRVRMLREYLAYVRADAIERLQQQYESAQNAPIYWQADVRSIIEANGRALTAKAPPRLGDWPDDLDERRLRGAVARGSCAPRRRLRSVAGACGRTRASRASACSARSDPTAWPPSRDESGLTSVIVVAADSGPLLAASRRRRSRIGARRSKSSSSTTHRPTASRSASTRCMRERCARARSFATIAIIGFGPACNRGAAIARGDALVFLNPDCMIEPRYDRALRAIAAGRSARLACSASRSSSPDGTPARGNRRRDPTLRRALMTT